MQLSTYIQEEKVRELDEYASKMNMSRSQILSLIIDYVLDNREVLIDYLRDRVERKNEDTPFVKERERPRRRSRRGK